MHQLHLCGFRRSGVNAGPILTDLNLDGVDAVDDDPTLANLHTIAGLHLRNTKAGSRSCGCLFPCGPSSCFCGLADESGTHRTK
jgi:hypothetical protein